MSTDAPTYDLRHETPCYDQLIRERTGAGDWTPDQLRPPLDLDQWLADSYMRVMARHHLLRQIAQRQRIAKTRRPRTTPLP